MAAINETITEHWHLKYCFLICYKIFFLIYKNIKQNEETR